MALDYQVSGGWYYNAIHMVRPISIPPLTAQGPHSFPPLPILPSPVRSLLETVKTYSILFPSRSGHFCCTSSLSYNLAPLTKKQGSRIRPISISSNGTHSPLYPPSSPFSFKLTPPIRFPILVLNALHPASSGLLANILSRLDFSLPAKLWL